MAALEEWATSGTHAQADTAPHPGHPVALREHTELLPCVTEPAGSWAQWHEAGLTVSQHSQDGNHRPCTVQLGGPLGYGATHSGMRVQPEPGQVHAPECRLGESSGAAEAQGGMDTQSDRRAPPAHPFLESAHQRRSLLGGGAGAVSTGLLLSKACLAGSWESDPRPCESRAPSRDPTAEASSHATWADVSLCCLRHRHL